MPERLSPPEAKARILVCLAPGGTVVLGTHAQNEMAKDQMTAQNVNQVLRGGWLQEAEWENGEWRYRVNTSQFVVVVAFVNETQLRVVTAWRIK